MTYRTFEEMPLWQEAHVFAVQVHEVSSSFPRQEDCGLTSQLRRAAVSVSANVAEAFGRYHYRDKLNFYCHSRGSLCELRSHLLYARDVGYVDPASFNPLVIQLDALLEQLNTVIATIRRRTQASEV